MMPWAAVKRFVRVGSPVSWLSSVKLKFGDVSESHPGTPANNPPNSSSDNIFLALMTLYPMLEFSFVLCVITCRRYSTRSKPSQKLRLGGKGATSTLLPTCWLPKLLTSGSRPR